MMRHTGNYFYILILILNVCLFGSCGTENQKLELALTSAGANRVELEKVLTHYQGDSLKLRAARYLIENMPYHFSIHENFVSTSGQSYYPDITRFSDVKAVVRHCDSLKMAGWRVERRLDYDICCVNADFLVRHIDMAFSVWRKPWAAGVSFDDFCRYVLPYRSQNEALSECRERFMKRYLPMLDSVGVTGILDACKVLNARLRKEIRYCETGNPLQATIEETEKSGIGACDALCNYAVLAMRSVGIPVAVHQTVWTRMDRGHVWCAVRCGDRFLDFAPGDVQPEDYACVLAERYYLQPAKVYRRHFEVDLSGLPASDDGFVTFLKNPLLEDVTGEQGMQSYNLVIPAFRPSSNSSGLVYLCAYNCCRWTPIAMGYREGDTCRFSRVAGRNLLMVADADERGGLNFVTAPFFTDGKGEIRMLEPDWKRPESLTFRGKAGSPLRSLYYWDTKQNSFERLSCTMVADSIRYYEKVPANALLWDVQEGEVMFQLAGMAVDGVFKDASLL